MNRSYLIPANTKRGQLIFSIFRGSDLILLGSGIFISMILLFIMGVGELLQTIIVLFPALFSAFLVLPIPNYHNVLTFFITLFKFLTTQRIYKWEGWRFYESTKEDK